ncbi:hypothetical protein P8452_16124 [Trifolium repens]|nr:hypothetical protein P8452_16124 [Trifolium repens]
MGLMQAELATASGLIQAGAAQTYSAAVNWKSLTPGQFKWIVLCLKFDAGKTGDYFRSDTDWCIIECQFGWWLDALGD